MLFFMVVCMVFKGVLIITSMLFGRTVSPSVLSFMSIVDEVLTYGWMLGTFLYVVKHEKEIKGRK